MGTGKLWQYVCILLLLAKASVQREVFRSSKAPREDVFEYETVFPLIEKGRNDSFPHLIVTLNSATIHYTLKLVHNVGLLSPLFSSRYHDGSGRETIQRGQQNCFYHGEVLGAPEWTVVFSTCLGLRGSFGPHSNPEMVYHIEPLHQGSSNLTQPHVLYLGSEYTNKASGTCGTVGHSVGVTHYKKEPEQIKRLLRQRKYAVVEWTLVNDNAQYFKCFSNLTLVVLRAIEIANGVDVLFKEQGVRVVVVDVVTWTIEDPILISTNSHEYLDSFKDYSPNLPQNYDSAMLFTGIDFDGSTIGIAFTATMCELQNSVGLVQDGGGSLDDLISTTAHELGHIFAMDHDTPSCSCEDATGICIMYDTLGSPPATTWSSCSVETLLTSLGGPLGQCLDNEPVSTFYDVACGNGILEEKEACDCGSAEECIDPCCNTTTCQLVAGAACRAGACCLPNCQFKEYGSVCRPASHDCDIKEYCSGYESDCPRDVGLQNLTPCMTNQSFCFSGVCQTREDQCQHHFETGVGIDECYIQVNTQGNSFGHCGFDDVNYIPCKERNVFCGQLQCDGGMLQTSPGLFHQYTLGSFICTSVTTLVGSDEISPGLVRDGTKCGDRMVCLNTECVTISSVDITSCPIDKNGIICSGQGLCNTKNQCSCSVGFIGSSCDEVVYEGGHGGGGQGQGGKGTAGVIAGSVMAVLVVIVGAAVPIVYFMVRFRSYSRQCTNRSVHNRPTTLFESNRTCPSHVKVPQQLSKPTPSKPPYPGRVGFSSEPSFNKRSKPVPKRPPPPSRPPNSATGRDPLKSEDFGLPFRPASRDTDT